MKKSRAEEIERRVIYRHLQDIENYLEDCEDSGVVFHIGRALGAIQCELKAELEKEVEE